MEVYTLEFIEFQEKQRMEKQYLFLLFDDVIDGSRELNAKGARHPDTL